MIPSSAFYAAPKHYLGFLRLNRAVLSVNQMGLLERRHFVPCLVMGLTSFASVLSQCAEESMKHCSNGLCDKECTTNVSNDGVEAIVAIMSISVILIVGLVILLVYICLKQGPLSQNSEATNDSNTVTCESTAVEIPEYLLRRRFSSLSMTSGPPPYFSLFNFICNENGEILNTVIGENLRTENARLPSTAEQPPEYGALFGTPPPYDVVVVQNEAPTARPETNGNAGC